MSLNIIFALTFVLVVFFSVLNAIRNRKSQQFSLETCSEAANPTVDIDERLSAMNLSSGEVLAVIRENLENMGVPPRVYVAISEDNTGIPIGETWPRTTRHADQILAADLKTALSIDARPAV